MRPADQHQQTKRLPDPCAAPAVKGVELNGAKKRTAAGRVLDLLDAFSRGKGSLRLTELSKYAGLSLPTTHRLVNELLEWGGVEQEESGKYRLSRKFLDLAATSTQAMKLRETALPHLLELHQRSGLNVQLAVQDDREIVYLEALRPHANWSGESRIGGRLPMHISGAGLVLLAHASPEHIDGYLSEPLRKYAENTVTDPDQLRSLLARVRSDRYIIAPRFLSNDAGGIAAPIVDETGSVVAAVGAVYFLDRDNPATIVDLVRLTANRISRAFSERPAPPQQRTLDFRRRHAGLL